VTVYLDNTGNASITASQVDNGSSDNCGIASMSVSPYLFNDNNIGANTVILTVVDVNGNFASNPAIVTVVDSFPPIITTQTDTVYLDSTGNVVIYPSDLEDGDCTVDSLSISPNTFNCSNIGDNIVTFVCTDKYGRVTTVTDIVTVLDTIVPKVHTKNICVYLNGAGNASITAADVDSGSTDNCGIDTMTVSPSAFSCANIGVNNVTLTVTDVNGNVLSNTAIVTVKDTIRPTIICCGDIFVTASCQSCNSVVTWKKPKAFDNCAFTVSSNYHSGDVFPLGCTVVTYIVTDAAGNKDSCSFKVTVKLMPLTASVLGENISCHGKKDGKATVSVSGGCLPYTYVWSTMPVQTTAVATGLGAGTYTVKVKDAKGQVVTLIVTITEPAVLIANAGPDQTIYYGYGPKSCANLLGTATGGTPSYGFVWSNGATTAATTVCPISTTTYNLSVTDANGCKANDQLTICVMDVRCDKGGNAIIKGTGRKVMVCHHSANNKTETICVDASAVPAHLAHGDELGDCGATVSCTSSARLEENGVHLDDHAETLNQLANGVESPLVAYPNPFANTTTLAFTATSSEQTQVEILDLNGNVLMLVYSGKTEAGQQYAFEVDGSKWNSYIYIARIMSNGISQNVKLVLNK
jgi:hypothetical protein